MGILDGIVEWIAEQVMYGLDLINTSVLGALGCDMAVFLRYFPAAETMYEVFVALAIGLILLIWVWNLFKNFGLGIGTEAEDPVKLTIRAVLFIGLAYYSDQIVDIVLDIGGTPYNWILTSMLPSLDFASFSSVLLTIIGVCANGAVALIVLPRMGRYSPAARSNLPMWFRHKARPTVYCSRKGSFRPAASTLLTALTKRFIRIRFGKAAVKAAAAANATRSTRPEVWKTYSAVHTVYFLSGCQPWAAKSSPIPCNPAVSLPMM